MKKTSKKKLIVTAIIVLAAIIIIPLSVISYLLFGTPAQYTNTFVSALSDKYKLLYSIKEPKIVIVGGSSVAFGLDSEMLSDYTGMPAVNFGLYATLGTKVMLDLSQDALGEGDIVIIAPELDAQTLSLFFNGEALWQACEDNPAMLMKIPPENRDELFSSSFKYIKSKLSFMKTGAPNPEGVYNRSSFNEYGDIIYERPYNIMTLGYDPNTTINLSGSVVSDDFIIYLNKYIKKAQKAGASVYFSFCPINKDSLADGTTEETILEFYVYLAKRLDCEIISDINTSIMESGYFYDSNFHLNDSGVTCHTAMLAEDIRRVQGNPSPTGIKLPMAPLSPAQGGEAGEDSPSADCFTYEPFGNYLIISGVTEKGKALTEVTIPRYSGGRIVAAIGENAFSECTVLEKIIIEDNITQINNGAFADCPALKKIMLRTLPAAILISTEGLTRGMNEDCDFIVPAEYLGDYKANYFWSNYKERIVSAEN